METQGAAGKFAHRVVAHQHDGKLIKGFVSVAGEDLRDPGFRSRLGDSVVIQTNDGATTVPICDLKALFFVRSFEGRKDYTEMKFFESNPTNDGLWVRLAFTDGERTEGIVHNSLHFVLEDAFLLKPPDPESNNELVLVAKQSLTDFRVLGVRSTY